MSRMDDAAVVREVTAAIEAAPAENRRQERLVVGLLVALFAVGLALLVAGAVGQRYDLLAPDGLLQAAIFFPIRSLLAIRSENRALLVLPQLMRLADSREAKVLAARLAARLIDKV